MLELTAYHEAGHAFAAVYVGARVQSVSIEPDPYSDGPSRFGETDVAWIHDNFTREELIQNQVMVALAGPVAEMIHSEDPWHPALVAEWAPDWKTAWKVVAPAFPDERKRLAYLEQASIDLHRLLSRDDFWSAIASLVDELLAHEALDGDEVHEVVEQALRVFGA